MIEQIVAEQKSRTQELRDWLDGEIKRVDRDVFILQNVLQSSVPTFSEGPTYCARYWGLTSDELEVKKCEDQRKLEALKKRLELLRSAQAFELGDSIEDLERVFGAPFTLFFTGGHYKFPPPIISFEKFVTRSLKIRFDICLATRMVQITHEAFEGVGDRDQMRASTRLCYPGLSSLAIIKWPEKLCFSFQRGEERSNLTFDKVGVNRCFLS